MPETRTLTAAGLWTNPNVLTGRPAGALSVAENVEIPQPGVLRPARGLDMTPDSYDTAGARLSSGTSYGGMSFEHTSANTLERYSDVSGYDDPVLVGGTPAVVAPPSGARVHFATAGGDLYLTTSNGLRSLDGATAALETPGLPRALDFDFSILYGGLFGGNTGGTGFIDPGNAVAYRAVLGENDAEGKPVLGAPSGRQFAYNPTLHATLSRTGTTTTVTLGGVFSVGLQAGDKISVSPTDTNNPGGTVKTVTSAASNTITYTETGPAGTNVGSYTVTILTRPTMTGIILPPGLVAGRHFVQLYRTSQVALSVDPGDDMRLVIERPLTAYEISTGYAYLIDTTPDVARGPPLYTNALQEGATQANNRPPLMADVAPFRQCLIGVDITRPQRLSLRFIGLPSAGDVLTVNGQSYTANVGGLNDSSGNWSVETSASYTVSQQLERTARAFIAAVNLRTGNTALRAYYVSGSDDPPGMVLLEALVVGASSFSVSASAHGTLYVPEISTAVSSVAEHIPNGVAISKQGLPYAFPPASQNLLRVGAEEKANLRGIALRDSFWVLKGQGGAGGGIWKITGSGPGAFYVEQVSESVYLLAPESAVVLDNQIYALTNKGVVTISDGGIEIVSVPIEDKIKALLDQPGILPTIYQRTVGVAYEVGTETKYILYLPSMPSDTYATRALVFNANPDIQAWTERVGVLGTTTGAYVNHDGKLVVGITNDQSTYVERKEGTAADFQLPGPSPALPIRFGWTVDSVGYPNAPKDFQEQTLQLGENHTLPWTIDWTTDLGGTATLQAYPEGRQYLHQWVHSDVAYCTRLGTVWSYNVNAENVSVLGFTTQMLVYAGGSTEM